MPLPAVLSRRSLLINAAAVVLGGAASFAAAPFLAGCGGSSPQPSSSTTRSTPSAITKTRVASLLSTTMRYSLTAGFGPSFMTSNIAVGAGAGVAASAPTTSTDGGSIPQIGAFLRNVASQPPDSRAVALRLAATRHARGRGEATTSPPATPAPSPSDGPPGDTTGDPPTVDPLPAFYYDYYLELWVQIDDTATQSAYSLFEDEAKTKPAGSIVTTWPADRETYPQTWQSTYSFTAGYLAGSHGSSINTTNADGSGSAKYDDTYTDGWSDSGSSTWSSAGDYTYTSRTDMSDGSWTEARGSWYANGSGGSHYATSDGYAADYVYSADGSGHGTITGNDPGLPVMVSWDAYGNTTIRYADGTTETIPGWGYSGGGDGGIVGTPIAVEGDGGIGSTPIKG